MGDGSFFVRFSGGWLDWFKFHNFNVFFPTKFQDTLWGFTNFLTTKPIPLKNTPYLRRYPQNSQALFQYSSTWFDLPIFLGLSIALGFPRCLITPWTKRTKIISLRCCSGVVEVKATIGTAAPSEWQKCNKFSIWLMLNKMFTVFLWDMIPLCSTKICWFYSSFGSWRLTPHIWQTFGKIRVPSPNDATAC